MKKIIIIFLFACIAMQSCKKSAAPPTKITTNPPAKFTITASSGPNGDVTPNGKSVYIAGTNVQYAIMPSSGYSIATLSVDGVGVTPEKGYIFTDVEADHAISATFLPVYTVSANAGPHGTVVPFTQVVNPGNSATITFIPSTIYLTDSLWIDGTFVKLLGGATSFTLTNVTANHSIKVSFSNALHKFQLDSLSNLLIGQWTMTSLQGRIAPTPQDNFFPWDIQPLYPCSNQYDQYYANGVYLQNNNGTSCSPLSLAQFHIKSSDHWALKNNGKVIYMTDAPLDSLMNITVTKDSLIAFYYAGYINSGHILYWYHYARKP